MRATSTRGGFVLLLGLASVAGCCCCGGDFQAAFREGANRASSIVKINQLTTAIISYKTANGQWPASLEDVSGDVADFDETMKNPVTGDDPGYEYVQPTELDPPPGTVIIYQLRDGAPDESLEKGFADGSVASEHGGSSSEE